MPFPQTLSNPNSNLVLSSKASPFHKPDMLDRPASCNSGPIRVDGAVDDSALSKSEVLTRPEVIERRVRRVKQLARIYHDHYWTLMEEVKGKYRQYCWEYGKSPFIEDEENDKINSNCGDCTVVTRENNGNLGVNGCNDSNNHKNYIGSFANICGTPECKFKAMALTRFCHMHILSDAKQKLYKPCQFSIQRSTSGPIPCRKPTLRSTVPSYCVPHFQKAEKQLAHALKKAGLSASSTSKSPPKFHVIVSDYVRQIKNKRRVAQRANLGNSKVKEENNS